MLPPTNIRAYRLLLQAVLMITCTTAYSQYKVHQWANFEDNKIPDDAVKIGALADKNLKVVDISAMKGMPPEFTSGAAAKETGKYALEITASPDPTNAKTFNTGLAVIELLDRDKLGEKGRALYQADFFIPPVDGELPSLAVLAMEQNENLPKGKPLESVTTGFYRFGLTLGKNLFFSCVLPGQDKAQVYNNDLDLLAQVPRPGWHRFAIVFEGPETIRCYVDGRETKFSPMREPTLRKLVVGVMLADQKRSYSAYMDNLSIQVSEDAPILPASPYAAGWRLAAANTTRGKKVIEAPPPLDVAQSASWIEPPTAAWSTAQKTNKPMLLYFYAPALSGTDRVDKMFGTDPAAKDFLTKHASSRVDVNSLQGGAIAKQYEVFKVPALLVISPDAKDYKRSVPGPNHTWSQISGELKL